MPRQPDLRNLADATRLDFAALRSYLSTATKYGLDLLDVLQQLFTTSPWLPPDPVAISS
jgi:hypothetical protein